MLFRRCMSPAQSKRRCAIDKTSDEGKGTDRGKGSKEEGRMEKGKGKMEGPILTKTFKQRSNRAIIPTTIMDDQIA